jgi:hypothetical protein
MIEKVIYEAASQAAVTSALTIHAGDPNAAAMAAASSLHDVFKMTLGKPRTPGTANTFSTENKFTTQAVLEGMTTEDRRRALDKEKSQLLKHAQ